MPGYATAPSRVRSRKPAHDLGMQIASAPRWEREGRIRDAVAEGGDADRLQAPARREQQQG
jgi:hypothetical protein